MSEEYGANFITVTDDDGNDFELEVLGRVDLLELLVGDHGRGVDIVPVVLAAVPPFSVHLYTSDVEVVGSTSLLVLDAYPVTAYIVGLLLFSVKLLILIFVPFNPY